MPKTGAAKTQTKTKQDKFELGRGPIRLAILAVLNRESACGYQIAKELRERDEALKIDYGKLYPMLENMEGRGLIKGRWEEGHGKNGLHMYDITPAGRKALSASQATFLRIMSRVRSLLSAGT